MAVYAIFIRNRTIDQAALDEYSAKAAATAVGHPMVRRVVYGRHEMLEGAPIEGVVVLEFPGFEEARAWYESPAYRDVVKHRWAGAEYQAFLVEAI